MSLSKFTDNLNNVQSLADRPTESAEELKRTFDTSGNAIKEYINQILTAEIDTIIQNIQDGKIDVTKIVNDLTTGGANKVASAEMIKQLQNNKAEQSAVNTALNGKANSSHTHTKSQITDFAHTHTKSQITDFAHTHTKSQITDFSHTHDDRYYPISTLDTKFNGKANSSHTHTTSQISGLKTGATTQFSSGTGNPSGGSNGDVYIQYFT